MGYEVHYDRTTVSSDRDARADLAQWLGWQRYKLFARAAEESVLDRKQFRMALLMAGVRGYPVTAFLDKYLPE